MRLHGPCSLGVKDGTQGGSRGVSPAAKGTGELLVPRPWKKRRQKKESQREIEGKANREGRKGPPRPSEERAGEGSLGGNVLQVEAGAQGWGQTEQSSRGGRHTGTAGVRGENRRWGQSREQRLGTI